MERLNEIIGTPPQRRRQHPLNQFSQHNQQEVQHQQNTFLPSYKQNARQGEPLPYTQDTQVSLSNVRTPYVQQKSVDDEENASGMAMTPHAQSGNSPECLTNGPTSYQQQSSEWLPPLRPPIVYPPQLPPPEHGYHYADEDTISPVVETEVVEDRDGDEDDALGMQYGDWEEGEKTSPRYNEQSYHPLVTREVSRPTDMHVQMDAMRSFRNLQLPVRQTRVQEFRPTQPLDSSVASEAVQRKQVPSQQHPLRLVSEQPKAQERERITYTFVQLPPVAPPAPAKSVCLRCAGAGYLRQNVPFGHPNFGKPLECECKVVEKKEKRRQQLLELSNLGEFRAKSLKNFVPQSRGMHSCVQEAFEEAKHYAKEPSGWLLLVGPNGCGKTHLAAAIANQSLDNGSVVFFTVVPDLLEHLRATFAPTASESYNQLFAKMREAELLVLDDLGAHQSSPWVCEKLFQLLNYRYNSQFPTVITANKSGLSSIDDRLLSRLSDVSLVQSVIMDGAQDYRRRNPCHK